MENVRSTSHIVKPGVEDSTDIAREPVLSIGVSPDGTVSTATPSAMLVVELVRGRGIAPMVITSLQRGIAGALVEVERYPLRGFLALVLRGMRAARRHSRMKGPSIASHLPARLRRAQHLALAQFIRVNFDRMMLIAHAPRLRPLLSFR